MPSKVTQAHQTFIPGAKIVQAWAEKVKPIKKFTAGHIKPAKSARSPRSIKVKEEEAGLLLVIRDTRAIQEMRLYTSDRESVIKALKGFSRDFGFTLRFG